jgi:NADH:ubiquinone oxidoreductase subunit 2 (subunit N)
VVKVMWMDKPASRAKVPSSPALRVALALSCLGVLALGIIPGYVMKLAQIAAQIFVF